MPRLHSDCVATLSQVEEEGGGGYGSGYEGGAASLAPSDEGVGGEEEEEEAAEEEEEVMLVSSPGLSHLPRSQGNDGDILVDTMRGLWGVEDNESWAGIALPFASPVPFLRCSIPDNSANQSQIYQLPLVTPPSQVK